MSTKHRLFKFWKYFRRTTELFIAFLFFYLIVVIYGAIIPFGGNKQSGDVLIYVQSNGIHTDICLPVETDIMDWKNFIPNKHYPNAEGYEYITLGWGDKGFFLDTPTWGELKVSTALNAAFLPSPTAMHVAYSCEPELNENRRAVRISKRNFKRLISFVKGSFRLKNKAVQLIEGKGYTPNDNFYEANNSYHLFNTCNSWTNKALKTAEIKTGIFALFPDGVIGHLN